MTERQRRAATTIVDVARAAQVSRATASRALAGYGRVRPATREKVLALAAELDYRPNTLARAVRAGRSAVIGLIVTDIANPFLAQLTKAVAGTAVELGYDLLIAETNEDQEAERRATQVFVEKRVDGLIVVPAAGHSHDHLLWASSHGAPLVLLDRSPHRTGLTSVTSDDYRSACEAVELLVGKGHSRIATITATWMGAGFSRRRPAALFSSAAGRVDGFRAGMKRAGLVPRPDWVLYASVAEPSALRAAAASLLSGTSRPTALLTNNSDVALAVVTACRDAGLRIGDDVSLVTFDDADWTQAFDPPVSIVSRPVARMGEMAVRELVYQIAGHPPSAPIVLPNTLVDRRSVGPPPSASPRPRPFSTSAS
jgi:LacI family transcriptional regulator